MYYVGLDISKFKHDCAVIDSNTGEVTPSWSFTNDYEGFSSLKAFLDGFDGEKRIGFESTGHYGQNLKQFLETNGFTFMEFNPLLTARFVRSKSLRRTKTDSIDALMIAQYLMTVEYKPYRPSFYTLDKLKSLTRFRDNLVRQRSRQLIELTNILDLVFPEFKPFFGGKITVTALHILTNYSSPERIANMNSRSYDTLRRLSRGHFSMVDFVRLKELAKNTVGSTDDYLLDQMSIVISIYKQLNSSVDTIEQQIYECVQSINPPMLSIPGIGTNSAAVLLAEYGDFSKFENASKMLSYAGLEPAFYQSGTSESTGKMVKHGSPYVRYVLMNCAKTVIQYEPTFATYFAKKRAEGKAYNVALSHTAKKLLRVIYALQVNDIAYSPELIR